MVEGIQAGEHAHDHEHGDHQADEADDHDDHDDHDDADDHDDHDDADADDHDHDDHHDEETDADHDHHHEGVEYDEHVWLSLRNSAALVNKIEEAMAKVDPANADTYKANAAAYVDQLNALDKEYQAAVSAGKQDTLVFGDRFPFRYLVDDYDLDYYAAFVGCSAETEASFETITFLAGKVDEEGLHAVMTIEGQDHRIAETVVQTTKTKDQKILTMDSLQSTTSKDVQAGVTYLSVMKNNLEVLKEALQ